MRPLFPLFFLAACTIVVEDKSGDDDDTDVGDDDDTDDTDIAGDDDDDDSTASTGVTGVTGVTGDTAHTGGGRAPSMVPANLTLNAQVGVRGGVPSDFSSGGTTYESLFFMEMGDASWDYNDPYSPHCTIVAPIGSTSGVLLAAEPLIGDAFAYDGVSAIDTDCLTAFTLPVGFDPTVFFTSYPDWAIGVSGAMSVGMQADMDAAGIPLVDQDDFIGAYWNIPILTVPVQEAWYTYGYALDGTGAMGAALVRSDVEGQATLPDAVFITTPLLVIPL